MSARPHVVSSSSPAPQLAELSPVDWDSDGDTMDDKWELDHYAQGTGLDPMGNDALMDADGAHVVNWSIGNDWPTPMTIVTATATMNGQNYPVIVSAPSSRCLGRSPALLTATT